MVVRIRRGLDLVFDGAPRQSIEQGPPIGSVALLGSDYPGIRFDPLVEVADTVAAGQPLLRQRSLPDRQLVAPVAGRVSALTRGARRRIATVEISPSGDDAAVFAVPTSIDRPALVGLLHRSGLWAAIEARPFGRPADLATEPDALFVTAMDTRPHAPDPAVVIAAHAAWFERGVSALPHLTSGKVFVCHAEGASVPVPAGAVAAPFAGRHPAGLASTHIHHLHPVGRPGRVVWRIGYQDVIALGHLLATGTVWTDRIVAVSGPALTSPTLLRTRPGASLRQLLEGRLTTGEVGLVAGSPLDGRSQTHLSRGELQVFARLPEARPASPVGLRHRLDAWMHAGILPIIPNARHEHAAPVGVLPIPLLRALSAGDVESARRLGVRELVEEDLSLLSHVDGSGADFGVLLRSVLDELEGAR